MGILGLVPLMFCLVAVAVWWHFSRSRSLLQKWADENGYRLLAKEYRTFRRGPFFWTSSKGQTVYRVSVEDKAGQVRSGWVRCGGWWLGLLTDHTEVRWDEAPARQPEAMHDRWIDG